MCLLLGTTCGPRRKEVQGALRCPLTALVGDRAKALAGWPVLVLGTGDYRGSQVSCVNRATWRCTLQPGVISR